MTSRERVLPLWHTNSPTDVLWISGLSRIRCESCSGILVQPGSRNSTICFRWICSLYFRIHTLPKPKILADGSWYDHMGVHRRVVKNDYCSYEEYASSPLGLAASAEDLERYDKWPDPVAFDWRGFSEKIGDLA